MSRMAESLKALKVERREVAARLSRIDRLIGSWETLNQLQGIHRRRRTTKSTSKSKSSSTPRKSRSKPAGGKKAPAGNLAGAAEL